MQHETPTPPAVHWRSLPHYLVLGALRLLCYLPRRWALGLGAACAKLFFTVQPYRKRIVAKNLAWAFPEQSAAEREQLLQAHIRSVGYGMVEMGMAWFWSDERLRRISRLEADPDSLAALQDPKQAVLLLGSHSTLLELGVRLLGLSVAATGMYRPQKSRFFDAWIRYQRLRASGGLPLLHFKDLRGTLSALQAGQNIWYAIDQDMGHQHSVFPTFFGLPTATVSLLPKLQERTSAQLIPVYFWREPDEEGKPYVVRIGAAIAPQSALPLMQEVNGQLEQEIRQHPEQYFWLHRRFKSDPAGGRRDY